jgi:hypothetical protein
MQEVRALTHASAMLLGRLANRNQSCNQSNDKDEHQKGDEIIRHGFPLGDLNREQADKPPPNANKGKLSAGSPRRTFLGGSYPFFLLQGLIYGQAPSRQPLNFSTIA